MNEKFSDADLEKLSRELEARRATAEQEIVEVEQLKQTVKSRQGVVSKYASMLSIRRADNHFGRDYEITMRTKPA